MFICGAPSFCQVFQESGIEIYSRRVVLLLGRPVRMILNRTPAVDLYSGFMIFVLPARIWLRNNLLLQSETIKPVSWRGGCF